MKQLHPGNCNTLNTRLEVLVIEIFFLTYMQE